jgi:hypothetical protein
MKQGHVDSLNATHARPGVVRRVFSGEGATLAFTTMDPGHEAVPHYGVTLGEEPIVALSVFSPKRDEYAAEEAG